MDPIDQGYLRTYLQSKLKLLSRSSNIDTLPSTNINTNQNNNIIQTWLTSSEFLSINYLNFNSDSNDTTITNTNNLPVQKSLENSPLTIEHESEFILPDEVIITEPIQQVITTNIMELTNIDYTEIETSLTELPITFTQTELLNTGINRNAIGNTTSLLGLGVKDLIGYKEKVIDIENLVEITKDDFFDYKLSDLININNFTDSDSVPLSNFPLPIQNAIGQRFLEFDGYIKIYSSIESGEQKFFYKNKIARLFHGMPNIMNILYEACTKSNIPEVLFIKFNNKIKIDLTKIYIQNDNLIPVMYEISISNRDTNLNKDIFIYYNLTKSSSITIDLEPVIKNCILSIKPITLNAEFTQDALNSNPEYYNQIIKYNSRFDYYYYETFTTLSERRIPKTDLVFRANTSYQYLWKVFIDKASNITLESLTESFRYKNSIFYIPPEIDDPNLTIINPIIPNQFKFFEEEYDILYTRPESSIHLYYKDLFYSKIMDNEYNIIDSIPVKDIQYSINIDSGYKHCQELKILSIDENYEPIINFIDIRQIDTENFNTLILAYFYKINRNNKKKRIFIVKTSNLMDADFSAGKFEKIYNFKDFFTTQFSTYLKINTDQIPFSGGFKSNIKNFIQTKSFNIDFIAEEISMYLNILNTYYSTNFQLISITPLMEDNGIYAKITIEVIIKIFDEVITLEIISQ